MFTGFLKIISQFCYFLKIQFFTCIIERVFLVFYFHVYKLWQFVSNVKYSCAPGSGVLVNDGPHIQQLDHRA